MGNKRDTAIDFLRALAILSVIITHVLSRNLGPETVNAIWNYLHFIVPLYIFCSGYLMYKKYYVTQWTVPALITWYKKRTLRLVLPYYLFLALHYVLWLIFPSYVSGFGLSLQPRFILTSLLFTGVDYGWLPLLFLELMLLTPLYLLLFRKNWIRVISFVIVALSSLSLLFYRFTPLDYRLFMWLPWSTIYFLSFAAARADVFDKLKQSSTRIAIFGLCSLLLFFTLRYITTRLQQPLTLTLHKYPPDLFYLSYGLSVGSVLTLASLIPRLYTRGLRLIIQWLSARSYELFFAHYLILDVLETITHTQHISAPLGLLIPIAITGSLLLVTVYDGVKSTLVKKKLLLR